MQASGSSWISPSGTTNRVVRRLKHLRVALGEVFVRPSYIALAAAVGLIALVLAIWLPNVSLLAQVFSDAQVPLAAKLGIAFSLLAGIATNFSFFSAGYTIAMAVLLGMDMALIVYLITQNRGASAGKNLVLGSGGIASGLVGIGCAACGSLILGGLVPSLAVAGVLAALPLQGEEFGILSVALLLLSLFFLSKNIAEPPACAIERGSP